MKWLYLAAGAVFVGLCTVGAITIAGEVYAYLTEEPEQAPEPTGAPAPPATRPATTPGP